MDLNMKKYSLLVSYLVLATSLVSPSLAQKEPPAVYSQNPQANNVFLKAREYYAKGDPRTGGKLANCREAIKLYQQAVEKDPSFALGYVELSRAWLGLGYSDPDGGTNEEILPPARAAALKAVELDPRLAEAHLGLASLSYNIDFDWQRAEREYKLALQLQPDNARANNAYAAFLSSMGKFREALEYAVKADSLMPSMAVDINFARIYYAMHRYDKAEDYCKKALARQDNVLGHFFLGLIRVAEEQYDKAIPELEIAAAGHNGGATAGLGYGYAMAGQKDRALEVLAKLNAGRDSGLIVDYRIAAVHLALGDKDRAIEWLNKSYNDRENWMNQLKVDPVMDPLRSDLRFKALMQKIHFS
jgi:tetratricopeptide (TPR) repeat protein